MSRRQLLLVLDNAEHLLGGVATIVKSLLSQCPGVTVLVTSREPLHLTGEQVYRLSTMPEAPPAAVAADLMRHDSTRLFLERTRASVPTMTVTDADAREIGEICRKLEGIPLAIELAAARVATLSVRELNERLSEKLPLLASRDSTQDRHRTLRATIDWSYRLLSEVEKRTFARLSVFAGGFNLEACERVAAAGEPSAIDLLESLVEKSFVQTDPNAENRRFRCLDVMQEYGWGELAAQRVRPLPPLPITHATMPIMSRAVVTCAASRRRHGTGCSTTKPGTRVPLSSGAPSTTPRSARSSPSISPRTGACAARLPKRALVSARSCRQTASARANAPHCSAVPLRLRRCRTNSPSRCAFRTKP